MSLASSELIHVYPRSKRWVHLWAVLTAVVTFPLILSGGTVTSLRVGMADPAWPTPPWYMLVIHWAETAVQQGIGFLIEHGHRQFGWLVGLMIVILAAWLWWVDGRRWVRWLGVATLAAVGFQGLLGGLRVLLNARWGIELAMVHGFFAQITFCLLASLALVTSRRWQEEPFVGGEVSGRFRRLCLTTTILLLVQLILGVWLRQAGRGVEIHILVALVVAVHAGILVVRTYAWSGGREQALRWHVLLLVVLVLLQMALGFAAWAFGAGAGAMDPRQVSPARALLATAHVGTGALVLATSVLLTLRSYRHLSVPQPAGLPLGTVKGVA